MLENDTPTGKQPQPVIFTAEQQAKIDEIVKKAMGRAGKDAREQLDIERAEKSRLTADLKAAQDALANATNTDERDKLREQIQSISQELESEKQSRRDSENREISYRRSALIAQACLDHDLIDAEIVTGLVENNIMWNPDRKSFDVVTAPREISDDDDSDDNSDDDVPRETTIAEFFADFAHKKPYLVRSHIRTGSGSGDSSRSGLPTGRQVYKVEDIFGKGSSSQLANRLAQKDPAEYRRMKAEARTKKLI
jgi:hypothetical protein